TATAPDRRHGDDRAIWLAQGVRRRKPRHRNGLDSAPPAHPPRRFSQSERLSGGGRGGENALARNLLAVRQWALHRHLLAQRKDNGLTSFAICAPRSLGRFLA